MEKERQEAVQAEKAVQSLKRTAATPSAPVPSTVRTTASVTPIAAPITGPAWVPGRITSLAPVGPPPSIVGPPPSISVTPPPMSVEGRRESIVLAEARKAREATALEATRSRMGGTDWYKGVKKEWGEDSMKGKGLRMGIAGAGMVAGGVLSSMGGAAGEAVGMGLTGASVGMAFGPMAAAIGGTAGLIFGGIKKGIEEIFPSTEKFNETMKNMASSIISSERVMASVRRGETLGAEALEALPGASSARILTAEGPEARTAAMRTELDRLRAEGETFRPAVETIRAGGSAAPSMTTARVREEWDTAIMTGERRRLAAVAVLESGISRGIEGVTREETRPMGSPGGGTTLYETILRDATSRSPLERTATAAERIMDLVARIAGGREPPEATPVTATS